MRTTTDDRKDAVGVRRAYAVEIEQLIGRRARFGAALFLFFAAGSSLFESIYFPHRSTAAFANLAMELLVCAGGLTVVHHRPRWLWAVTVVCVNMLAACICSYFVWTGADADMCVILLSLLLTGMVVILPWGVRGQLLGSIAALVGYPLAMWAGVSSDWPLGYGLATLSSVVGFTLFGAYFLDTHRWSAFERLEQLHRSNAQLSQANLFKDELLANVSHDLRTPLSVIIGYGQLALDGSFGELRGELHDTMARIMASARQQLALVDDLLDLSRLELSALTVHPVSVEVEPLLGEMASMAARLIGERPVRVQVDAHDPNTRVHADPDRLRQILTNLVSNAVKFTDEGCIELVVSPNGPHMRIDVRDTGIGIAHEQQQAIFAPFCRLDPDRERAGAGLGLAITRRLAHLMNGQVGVESTPGRGSTFWVALPKAPAN